MLTKLARLWLGVLIVGSWLRSQPACPEQAPRVLIAGIEEGQKVTGIVKVQPQFEGEVGQIELVKLLVDGKVRAGTGSAPWVLEWNTAATTEGEHTLQVAVARSGADELLSQTKKVEVLVPKPPAGADLPQPVERTQGSAAQRPPEPESQVALDDAARYGLALRLKAQGRHGLAMYHMMYVATYSDEASYRDPAFVYYTAGKLNHRLAVEELMRNVRTDAAGGTLSIEWHEAIGFAAALQGLAWADLEDPGSTKTQAESHIRLGLQVVDRARQASRQAPTPLEGHALLYLVAAQLHEDSALLCLWRGQAGAVAALDAALSAFQAASAVDPDCPLWPWALASTYRLRAGAEPQPQYPLGGLEANLLSIGVGGRADEAIMLMSGLSPTVVGHYVRAIDALKESCKRWRRKGAKKGLPEWGEWMAALRNYRELSELYTMLAGLPGVRGDQARRLAPTYLRAYNEAAARSLDDVQKRAQRDPRLPSKVIKQWGELGRQRLQVQPGR